MHAALTRHGLAPETSTDALWNKSALQLQDYVHVLMLQVPTEALFDMGLGRMGPHFVLTDDPAVIFEKDQPDKAWIRQGGQRKYEASCIKGKATLEWTQGPTETLEKLLAQANVHSLRAQHARLLAEAGEIAADIAWYSAIVETASSDQKGQKRPEPGSDGKEPCP